MRVYGIGLFLLLCTLGFRADAPHLPQRLLVQLAEGVDLADCFPLSLGDELVYVKTLSRRLNVHLFEHAGVRPVEALAATAGVKGVFRDEVLEFRVKPDDPGYSRQWGLERMGLPEVWETTTGGITAGGDTLVLAIVDSGFDTDHEDMAAQVWINRGEVPGNGKDDDNNGYVDDYRGWSFDTDSPVHLPDNHGQSVAGIAGASGDNGLGVCGVNWNIRLMVLSVGTIADVISAYDYISVQRDLYNRTGGSEGAFVVATNASFGVNRNAFCSEFPVWNEMMDAMGAVGVLTAAGTSNRNVDIDVVGDTPSGCPSDYVISTLNITASGQKGPTSSFGKTGVDLGSPGDGSYTTKPFDQYGTFGQNSAAAPHLTGAIGLLYALPCAGWSARALTHPAETALEVKDWILRGVTPNANLSAITVTGGELDVSGSLRLAMEACSTTTSGEVEEFGKIEFFPNPTKEMLHIRFFAQRLTPLDISLFDKGGRLVRSLQLDGHGAGEILRLSTEGMQPGLYVLVLREAGRSRAEKVIILP